MQKQKEIKKTDVRNRKNFNNEKNGAQNKKFYT